MDSCGILDKVKYDKFSQYSPELKFGFIVSESIQLNQAEYRDLFEEEMVETDTCYLFGKYEINKDRIGVYSYRTTYECDHRIRMIEFSIFEKCKKIDSKIISFEDNDGFLYSISSKFNKDFNQLTIIERRGSEYGTEPGATRDTLFINTFKVDLNSKNLDTVDKNTQFEIIKSPPQK